MINNVVLVGRITRDPELRTITNGSSTVSFSLAIDRPYTSQNGERTADFINCVAWNATANFIGNYVKKGYLLGVEGRIQTRTYQNKNNETVYVTEVNCSRVQNLQSRGTNPNLNGLGSNTNSYNNQNNNSNYNNYNNSNQNSNNAVDDDKSFTEDISDEDLPF